MISEPIASNNYQAKSAATAGRAVPVATDRFRQTLTSLMQAPDTKQVSEEELFAALLQERIAALGGDATAKTFQEALNRSVTANRRADGSSPVELSANQALKELVAQGLISKDNAAQASREAFSAAQLDNNSRKLYDGRGGPGDSATAGIATAIASAIARLAVLGQAQTAGTAASSAVASSSSTVSGGGGFMGHYFPAGYSALASNTATIGLAGSTDGFGASGGPPPLSEGMRWNPVSTHIGKLAVVLPYDMPEVERCSVVDINGQVIEKGMDSGFDNGRAVYRFTERGEAYPSPSYLEVCAKNGSRYRFLIPEAGKLLTGIVPETSWT